MPRRAYSRRRWLSTLALLIVLGCAGCVSRFVYVVDSNDDSVSVYAIDSAAGRLRSLGYQPTGASPRGIAFRADGRFAYVVNAGTAGVGSISAYAVDAATGTLTRLDADSVNPGIQDFPSGPGSRGLAIRGDFLYVANFGIGPGATGSVSAFAVDSTSGMLAPIAGQPIGGLAAGINPIGIVSNGTFIYVLNSGGPNLISRRSGISAYTVTGTGALTRIDANPASPAVDDFETSRMPEAIVLRHDGKGIVVANGDLGTISVYDIDAASGALSRVDADATTAGIQDFAIGSNPRALASANEFVYTANRTALATGTLATFRASPGALAHVDSNPATPAIDDLPIGTTPAAVGIATSTSICGFFGVCSRNDFVYVADSGSDIDTVSTDDFATGAMSAKPEAPTIVGRRGPMAIATISGRSAVSIATRRAFVSHAGNAAEGVVWSYDVDPSTGALIPISTAHIGPEGAFAGRPTSIVATADGKSVYAVRSFDGWLAGYTVNPATGVLGVAEGVPTNFLGVLPLERTQVLIDPSQRFLYYATSQGIRGFSIDTTSGALTALPGSPSFDIPVPPLAMHPSGRFLYGSLEGTFRAIAGSTGGGRIADFFSEIYGAAVDPSGRFLYFAGRVSQFLSNGLREWGVAAYRIDASTGAPIRIDFPYQAPPVPRAGIVADPLGRFLFVGVGGGVGVSVSAIAVFRIDSASGALSPIDADPSTTLFDAFATEPFFSFNVEPMGRFLYVPQFTTDGGIFAYRIDSANGSLSPIDTDPNQPGTQGYPSSFRPTAIAFWSEIK